MWALVYQEQITKPSDTTNVVNVTNVESLTDKDLLLIYDTFVGDNCKWIDRLRQPGVLTPELLRKDWRQAQKDNRVSRHPMSGYCYVTTEALGAVMNQPRKRRHWMPTTAVINDSRFDTRINHWWLSRHVTFNLAPDRSTVGRLHLDPTADQFDDPIPYHSLDYYIDLSTRFARTKRCYRLLDRIGFKR